MKLSLKGLEKSWIFQRKIIFIGFILVAVMLLVVGCDEDSGGDSGALFEDEILEETENSNFAGQAVARDEAQAAGRCRDLSRWYDCGIIGDQINITRDGKQKLVLDAEFCREKRGSTKAYQLYCDEGVLSYCYEPCDDGCSEDVLSCAAGEEPVACEDDDQYSGRDIIFPWIRSSGDVRFRGTMINSHRNGNILPPQRDECRQDGRLKQVQCGDDGSAQTSTSTCPEESACNRGVCIEAMQCGNIFADEDKFTFGGVVHQYKGSDDGGTTSPKAKYINFATGETIERPVAFDQEGHGTFNIKEGGVEYRFQSASPTNVDDWDIEYDCSVCGDGVVDAGFEECDGGADCTATCNFVGEVEVELGASCTAFQLPAGQWQRWLRIPLTHEQLPGLLEKNNFHYSGGVARYTQEIMLSNGIILFRENDDDVEANFLEISDNRVFADYILQFMGGGLQYSISDSGNIENFEGQEIRILNEQFVILQAFQHADRGSLNITLFGSPLSAVLLHGESSVYTVNGIDYEIALSMENGEANFMINGGQYGPIREGTYRWLDGHTFIGVNDIIVNSSAGGVNSTSFYLSDKVIVLRDDELAYDVDDDESEIIVNDQIIEGTKFSIQGVDDGDNFSIYSLNISMTSQDDYYVPVGGSVGDIVAQDEPELLFTENWDIHFVAYDEDAEMATIQVGQGCGVVEVAECNEARIEHLCDGANLRNHTYNNCRPEDDPIVSGPLNCNEYDSPWSDHDDNETYTCYEGAWQSTNPGSGDRLVGCAICGSKVCDVNGLVRVESIGIECPEGAEEVGVVDGPGCP
jgi:hypothetical protein